MQYAELLSFYLHLTPVLTIGTSMDVFCLCTNFQQNSYWEPYILSTDNKKAGGLIKQV